MPATSRIPVQVTPKEKTAFEKKAKRLHVSVGELARRAMKSFDGEADQEAQVDTLLSKVRTSTSRAEAAVDDALAFIEASNKRIAAMERKAAS